MKKTHKTAAADAAALSREAADLLKRTVADLLKRNYELEAKNAMLNDALERRCENCAEIDAGKVRKGIEELRELIQSAWREIETLAQPVRHVDVKTPPTVEELLAYAHRIGIWNDAYVREWHRVMSEEYQWRHSSSGDPIRHWPAYFRYWRLRDPNFAALPESAR